MIEREVIDCDVHAVVPSVEVLFPYLDEPWREYISQSGFKGAVDTAYPKAPTSARPGSTPATGPAGSSLDLLREQALDAWGSRLARPACQSTPAAGSATAPIRFSRSSRCLQARP